MSEPLPNVLIVSTHSTKISILKRALRGISIVIEAHSSDSTLEWLKSEPIPLIILDQKSLSTDWQALCSEIRTLPSYTHTPILLISSNHKKSFYIEALNLGITDFINEPLDATEISQRVLVAAQTQPANQKVALISKKFNKKTTSSPAQQPLNKKFITTEDLIEKILNIFHSKDPFCLLMLEIDQWGKMKKTFAENGLKELLTQIETFLKKHLRTQDILLPQEGSRFLILLPKTSHRAGMLIAENLRADASGGNFQILDGKVHLTFSIGCTPSNQKLSLKTSGSEQFETLLTQVAQGLKKARRKGNRIITDKDPS